MGHLISDATHIKPTESSHCTFILNTRHDPCTIYHFNTKKMSLFFRIILVLTVLLVICEARCPHPTFMRKHLCRNCRNNANSATQFAIGVDNWRERRRRRNQPRVTTNTVFIGSGNFYPGFRPEPGDLCIFRKAAPKFVCNLTGGHWGCVPAGTELAIHSGRTGHYFH